MAILWNHTDSKNGINCSKSSTVRYRSNVANLGAVANLKTEVYSLDWKDVDLQGSLVSGASSGGAIGLWKYQMKLTNSHHKR